MRLLKLLYFTIRHHARCAHWQAGAEFVGGDRLRERALSHARLRSMGAEALRGELAELRLPATQRSGDALPRTQR